MGDAGAPAEDGVDDPPPDPDDGPLAAVDDGDADDAAEEEGEGDDEVVPDLARARRASRSTARSFPPPHAVARAMTTTPMSAPTRLLRVTLAT
ncbi:MAG TPA: hypothetical protein VIH82_06080 [Acidimicrobiia bacterium]